MLDVVPMMQQLSGVLSVCVAGAARRYNSNSNSNSSSTSFNVHVPLHTCISLQAAALFNRQRKKIE